MERLRSRPRDSRRCLLLWNPKSKPGSRPVMWVTRASLCVDPGRVGEWSTAGRDDAPKAGSPVPRGEPMCAETPLD